MVGKRALIAVAALVALIVLAYVWWPSALASLQELHGPLGGPGMHGGR
jgi:hypothetical protein